MVRVPHIVDAPVRKVQLDQVAVFDEDEAGPAGDGVPRTHRTSRWWDDVMVRVIPEKPTFRNSSEELAWQALSAALGDDDVLHANLRLTDGDKDHEADLVAFMPGVGVLVLEVKGGSVSVEPDEADGHVWWTQSGNFASAHPPG